MVTAMQSIKDMVDVNTIVGDPVQSPDGTVIIPISKVTFGFVAGGGEYEINNNKEKKDSEDRVELPFAGGSSAGISINPVAFMVVGNEHIKLLPVNLNTSVEKILDIIPDILTKTTETIKKKMCRRNEGRDSVIIKTPKEIKIEDQD